MSEIKLVSPILDNFVVGDPISDKNGVCSYPAINESTDEKCIVKIISIPPSQTQLDALLLSGAYQTKEDALQYYEELTSDIVHEVHTLEQLSKLEGFIPFDAHQVVPMDDGNGFHLYLRNGYKPSLARKFTKETLTHLSALNLGLDLCAALTVCRRSGYIYVDLKPENIYITPNGYRIGDIGFLNLSSLRFASLPDRYRSAYTAPELSDPMTPLNGTIDVYAVGLILYQTFNGGILPTFEEGTPLPPPDYADYEMAEIILKACALSPDERWEDPAQLGNALVSYMQRNGAHDTPIVPPVVAVEPAVQADDPSVTDKPEEDPQQTEEKESEPFAENDETLPGEDLEDLDYEQVSEEVSEILNQADDLIAHETPDPVLPPDPVDVQQLAEEVIEEEVNEAPTDAAEESDVQNNDDDAPVSVDPESDDDTAQPAEEPVNPESETEDEEADNDDEGKKKPKRRWIVITAILAAILLLLTVGILYYKNVYVQHISELTLEGNGTGLTVYVKTDFDESKLVVVCSDTYNQNHREAALVNGVAQFEDLPLDSPFTITVKAKGFHTLKGETTKNYATPKATKATDFIAMTGHEDGSVYLSFAVSGPDSSEWTITYSAEGEQTQSAACTGHSATISSLRTDKEYTFVLTAGSDILLLEEGCEIKYTPGLSVIAENLHVSSYEDGKLSVSWTPSKSESAVIWEVLCYSNIENKNELTPTETETTTVTFEGLSESEAYTIEVRAKDVFPASSITVPANPVKVENFTATTEDGVTVISWDCANDKIDDRWVLQCTNLEIVPVQTVDAKSVTLNTLVPGIEYHFILTHADASVTDTLVGNCLSYQVPEAEPFDNYGISADEIIAELCKKVEDENAHQQTSTFRSGDEAYLGIILGNSIPDEDVLILYTVTDHTGSVVDATDQIENWEENWQWNGKGRLYIPYMPDMAGAYTLTVYFNGAVAITQDFTITE